ncbi:MAG TPA: class I SAM-dependent methyltransferase [Mycobacteriales bacterium]|nr:class I SAM-dependent methyltransferase [Mycobacteriales bacterium]
MTAPETPTPPTPEQRKQMTAAVFDRAAASYEQVVPFFTTPGRRLVELAEVSAGMTVVDLGAGRGAVTLPAAAAVGPHGRVIAGDLAPQMVDLLRADLARAGMRNVEAHVMDAESPDLPGRSADRVLGAFMIFFLPDPHAALRRYAQILRPDGRLGLTIFPGTDDRWTWWGEMLEELKPPQLPNKPDDPGPVGSPERLAETLVETGYADIAQTEERHEVVFPDAGRWWDWVWSQGQRAALEQVPAEAIPALRSRAFERFADLARPDGSVVLEQRVTYTLAAPR